MGKSIRLTDSKWPPGERHRAISCCNATGIPIYRENTLNANTKQSFEILRYTLECEGPLQNSCQMCHFLIKTPF